MVGTCAGLPRAIRDLLDNVHLADTQREHLQYAEERYDESRVSLAVACTTTRVSPCCLALQRRAEMLLRW